MQLTIPPPYIADMGRSLPPEEFILAAREVTPIEQIKSRTCKKLGDNSGYRPGRSRR